MSPGIRATRTLYLLRHGEAAYGAPGIRDHERPLAERGRRQAAAAGGILNAKQVEMALASTATRAMETAQLANVPVAVLGKPELYNASVTRLRAVIARIPEYVNNVLIVGHSPGIPDLVRLIADERSDSTARDLVRYSFPPGTLVGLDFIDSWSDLHRARLFLARKLG
jgi:phosphohistidine phosphatase